MDEFWGVESDTSLRAVDVYITKLRDKFSICPDFEIKTVRGLGYKAVVQMRGRKRRRLESRFPPSLFALYLVILLLMSGIHTGLITLSNEYEWNAFIQIILPITYWSLVAVGLTVFTRHQIAKTYDHPMKELAKAALQVAQGDFSVYIPPLHTSNRYDYLDLMFLDFNKMVAELGSLETMRTDFIANVSHEIKTPLATIQNYAQLLQNPSLTKEEQDTYTAVILSSTQRAVRTGHQYPEAQQAGEPADHPAV